MCKGLYQVTSQNNFSDLSHVFFNKRVRDEALPSFPSDNTLKKLKTLKTQSAATININESISQIIQKQLLNSQLSTHSDANQNQVVVQPPQEVTFNILHDIPQENIEKTEIQEQFKDEKEQNEMVLETSDLAQMEFYCQICQKQYKNKKTYNSHVQTKHNDTRPFLCSICQKSFKRPDYLQKHKESHKQDKRFPCNECDRKFKSKHTHEKHVKTVHKKIICGTCQCCNKGFTRMDYFKKHLQRRQQKYKCNYQGCGKKLASKQSMERQNVTMHQG